MASSPLLRKSHSDRCAKRDPRARRVRRMINRADMQIFRQTVPPMRRSRSDRCARRDPRARRGSPMIRRADMRVGQTVPPLRRSQSDRCAQRDPRAHADDKRPSRAAMRLPPFKGAAWGWTQGGHHSRAQARQGGGAGRRAARARTRASHPQQSCWGGGMRARVPCQPSVCSLSLSLSPERAPLPTTVRQRATEGRSVQRSASCTTSAGES